MTKTFTPDDLLRYLYEDTSIEEALEIEKALQDDYRLQMKYEQLRRDIELLDEVAITPSEECIDQVMNYARVMNMNALCN